MMNTKFAVCAPASICLVFTESHTATGPVSWTPTSGVNLTYQYPFNIYRNIKSLRNNEKSDQRTTTPRLRSLSPGNSSNLASTNISLPFKVASWHPIRTSVKCSESVFTASLLKARTQQADQAESYEGSLLADFFKCFKSKQQSSKIYCEISATSKHWHCMSIRSQSFVLNF